MRVRVAHAALHRLVPTIGDGCEPWIKRGTQAGDEFRQWVAEVLVLASSKAVLRHDDAASEMALLVVEPGYRFTFGSGQEIFEHHPSVRVEMLQEARPIESLEIGFKKPGRLVRSFRLRGDTHPVSFRAARVFTRASR